MSENTRSPIKDKPLRLPGQSLQDERDKLLENSVNEPLVIAAIFFVLALVEWWRFYMDVKINPLLWTAAAVIAVIYAAIRIQRVRPKLRNLRQGLEGERAVGQFLERLREQGFQVFHDVVGHGFNLDHVLIGPAGVLTIETKTWSKPIKGSPEISFDGEAIRVGQLVPDRDPVVQAKAQAGWLRSLLAESTGRQFDVRPAIVFPGWFVANKPGALKDVWVLEPKALPTFLNNEPVRLSRDEIKLASFHLSRLIRSSEKQAELERG
jgi:hypothetical protein